MSEPVTRGELRKELKRLRSEFQKAIEPLATKVELELWGGALLARLEPRIERLESRIESMQQQLQADLARHANALHESMAALIRGHDDKYKDLPPRVGRLEAATFAPKPR